MFFGINIKLFSEYYPSSIYRSLREGVKKYLKVTDRFVNGGGGLNPQSNRKEKKMQNVLKRKYVAKYVYLNLFYVLDCSGSFDMHIEK